jgi:DNA-binding response OmpR family regulator
MSTEQLHVLVIDDNTDILYMLQAMLKLKGYKVSVKENTTAIESFIQEIVPDIILMDMLLSGADGRELCKNFKANTSIASIPVIMLSAHPHARIECLAAGADFFIEKPFEMTVLLQTVLAAEKKRFSVEDKNQA